MSIKKKLGLGIASAALGMSLVGGGTFAYFNDTATSSNTFAAGTLDLAVNPETIISLDELKPGDKMYRTFNLENKGSLDISKVILSTDYTVTDAKGDNVDDFGNHIKVHFLVNEDKPSDVIFSTTLSDLKGEAPDAVQDRIFKLKEKSGLEAGDSDRMHVLFEFVDNNNNQNEFQGDSLVLNWTFEAKQTKGEIR